MEAATQTDELLNDTGELDTARSDDTDITDIDEQLTREADEPVHLAKCTECASAVQFRSNVTGTGFFLVDADPDAVFGVGPNGRPVCPNGHGEMSIADEKLPAAEAFALVQEKLDGPVQRDLPGVFPAFNFEACFMELEAKAVEVDRLHREYKSLAEEAREAKKEWDGAAELYTKMALEFRRRRQAKEDGTLEGTASIATPDRAPCTWEAKHPTLRVCPICSGLTVAAVIDRLIGTVPPPDAAAHVESVDALLLALEIEALSDSLQSIDHVIGIAVIAAWDEDERAAALVYANAMLDMNGQADAVLPERPAILGKPHIPASALPGEHQVCSLCEVVIKPASEIEADGPYALTDLVGVDCAGKVVTGHRYPKSKGSKKPAAAKAKKKASR